MMRPVHILSWYPKFNGNHFGLPPSSIHRMTRLGGNSVLTCTTHLHRPYRRFREWRTSPPLAYKLIVDLSTILKMADRLMIHFVCWPPIRVSLSAICEIVCCAVLFDSWLGCLVTESSFLRALVHKYVLIHGSQDSRAPFWTGIGARTGSLTCIRP